MTVLLVRHADAGDRHAFGGPDEERPLSSRGRAQAAGLVAIVRPFAPVALRSSPAVRCRETLEPVADALGLDVIDDGALAEGAGAVWAHALDGPPADTVVLCSHGDVIPDVLGALHRRGLGVPTPVACEKASTWVLHTDGRTWSTAHYLAPPPAE